MIFEIGFLFALSAGLDYLLLTEKLLVDLTAFPGLVVLIFGGYPMAAITTLALFGAGKALLETEIAADLVHPEADVEIDTQN